MTIYSHLFYDPQEMIPCGFHVCWIYITHSHCCVPWSHRVGHVSEYQSDSSGLVGVVKMRCDADKGL